MKQRVAQNRSISLDSTHTVEEEETNFHMVFGSLGYLEFIKFLLIHVYYKLHSKKKKTKNKNTKYIIHFLICEVVLVSI